MSVPQIHFEHPFFTSPETDGLHLQRPASADAHALRRTKYLNPAYIRHTAQPRLRVQAGPPIQLDSTIHNSDLSGFSSAPNRPRRLTWVESERIWIVTSPSTGSPTTSSTWGDVNWSAAAYRPPPLQHSRSMDMTLTHSQAHLPPDDDDLPPPYERHYFDRPLPHLPPQAGMDSSVGGSAYSQNTSLDSGQRHTHSHNTRASRWTEIARRMNRTPVG
ncbi:hypothetical protein KXX16_000926 [Aspergillus fumigatus]|uniref:Uncharacterized protein n=1 Tax=Aspergillus fumigatus TaxID=746128 RepID=A0A9P8SS94_ASPFM|nr:hypothetical protein KXX11_000209 [Aspergillus fumigatus]KAH1308905.1 hypothetical protein KXX66_001241 [Aspergillus fumigatus]KAH1319282.1 hypothetical protein KXX47_002032 [Aspergillus fumigatus]KAH1327143.1 hypothetical protein KXX38_005140 [Aspergillus fumigatus]KAH1337003.1 hypothetical protein KXX67_002247 [Aspergillus fumigatus]